MSLYYADTTAVIKLLAEETYSSVQILMPYSAMTAT